MKFCLEISRHTKRFKLNQVVEISRVALMMIRAEHKKYFDVNFINNFLHHLECLFSHQSSVEIKFHENERKIVFLIICLRRSYNECKGNWHESECLKQAQQSRSPAVVNYVLYVLFGLRIKRGEKWRGMRETSQDCMHA